MALKAVKDKLDGIMSRLSSIDNEIGDIRANSTPFIINLSEPTDQSAEYIVEADASYNDVVAAFEAGRQVMINYGVLLSFNGSFENSAGVGTHFYGLDDGILLDMRLTQENGTNNLVLFENGITRYNLSTATSTDVENTMADIDFVESGL